MEDALLAMMDTTFSATESAASQPSENHQMLDVINGTGKIIDASSVPITGSSTTWEPACQYQTNATLTTSLEDAFHAIKVTDW